MRTNVQLTHLRLHRNQIKRAQRDEPGNGEEKWKYKRFVSTVAAQTEALCHRNHTRVTIPRHGETDLLLGRTRREFPFIS